MIHRSILALTALALCSLPPAFAGAAQKLPDKPVGAEVRFVATVQKTLRALYPTPASAERAGYFRYTNEDDTGAISYVDPAHWASDLRHPSQLWYDVHGRLLGADYSEPMAGHPHPPHLWGVTPGRWRKFDAHIHWVLSLPNGGAKYELATSVKKYEAAGGDVRHPTAEPIVKMGRAKSAAQVAHVFAFPNLWDLELWVLPNPKGAFANANPLVHPSKPAKKMSGM